MVDQDTNTALPLLDEPALMVSAQGVMKFDHAGYQKMAGQGTMVVTAFEFSAMEVVFPNDTSAILCYRVKQTVSKRGVSKSQTQEMADTSTWVQNEAGNWRCVMHTETPTVQPPSGKHRTAKDFRELCTPHAGRAMGTVTAPLRAAPFE